MDGLTFSGLTSASLRVFTAERGGETSPAVAFVPSREGPVDSVEIANAVRQPEDYDEVRMALERQLFPERIPTSLWGLLEAIKNFFEKSLQKAREEKPEYFEKLQELSQKLLGAQKVEELETMGQLVAASSPEGMDRFLAAAEEMTQKLLGQASDTRQDGRSPEGFTFKMSDVTLSIQPLGENKVSVQFEGAKLQVLGPSGGTSDRPVAELKAAAGQFTVQTSKAEDGPAR